MPSGIIPLEVNCEELKMYTINPNATTKIAEQKVIANEPMKEKNDIINILN